jgi:hypothetical protein
MGRSKEDKFAAVEYAVSVRQIMLYTSKACYHASVELY